MRRTWPLFDISVEKLTQIVVGSWFLTGCVLTIASFGQFLTPSLMSIVVLPVLMTGIAASHAIGALKHILWPEKILVLTLFCIWAVHATGLIVPETGFDAVWYHLPVAQKMVEAGGFVYLPEMYQSINPLFSDLLFVAGYGVYGEIGVKIVAYAIGLSLIQVTFQLARIRLSLFWSLWVSIIVSTFQVVTWQSSSFYVDLAKAMWEISALWLLLSPNLISKRWQIVVSGSMLGAAIGTKAFTWVLLPVFGSLLLLNESRHRFRSFLVCITAAVVIAIPFYLRAWMWTRNPLVSISLHVGKLNEIGGEAQLPLYLWQRLAGLPLSLFDLTLFIRDYVSLVLLVLLPIVLWQARKLVRDEVTRAVLIFGIAQYCIWWFVPPLSTRYAISGFVALILVWIIAGVKAIEADHRYFKPVVIVLLLATIINLAPRVMVAERNIQYIVTKQTKAEYIEQFYDGSIDEKLKLWHGLQ